jgi:hypothetical protein
MTTFEQPDVLTSEPELKGWTLPVTVRPATPANVIAGPATRVSERLSLTVIALRVPPLL